MFQTPVLFLIFNRPDVTKQVFERIRCIKPQYLYIAADGPRKDKDGEEELCIQTRAIIKEIDWDCELKTLFREENLGCAKNVSSAITWFFEHVEKGIILEDDCLPDLTFFSFCEILLEKYKENKSIGAVCGHNNQLGISRTDKSYYFAKLHSSWGWATWADRWIKYNEIDFPNENILNSLAIKEWKPEILSAYQGKTDSWAYRWQYVFAANDFIAIYPNVSLIDNIGFDEQASNTKETRWWYKHIQLGQIPVIDHPEDIKICTSADRLNTQLVKSLPLNWADRLRRKWNILVRK